MKIFDMNETYAENVSETMHQNLVKNVFAEEQVNPQHRNQALHRLAEAAELFEQSGHDKKAQKITNLIHKLAVAGTERDTQVKDKIALLEVSLNKLNSLNKKDELNNHYKTSCENKIRALISTVAQTSDDLMDSVNNLKISYTNAPKTLEAINESVKVAQATIVLMDDEGECADELDVEDDDKSWED